MAETISIELLQPAPHLAVPAVEDAIAIVNRWLHREVGMALNVSFASFNPSTFCWHLPVQLAYGATGPLGVVGDIYLNAATGQLVGAPAAVELQRRAEAMAAIHGIEE